MAPDRWDIQGKASARGGNFQNQDKEWDPGINPIRVQNRWYLWEYGSLRIYRLVSVREELLVGSVSCLYQIGL